ncbi:MAG: molybdenum cofactor biosynthesis protein [Acidimicrobiia bacterium]|nr:molybdenum cofactor biosynthesis protein [Acidimicrobiia bacterium]
MNRRRASVLTVSDGVKEGTRPDASGDRLVERLGEAGFDITERRVVPDEQPTIEEMLTEMASASDLVITTGGTGFGPRDVTPEATAAVLDRPAPGLVHLLIATGLEHTPMAALSRQSAGVIGSSLVCNLPGSTKAVDEGLDALLPIVDHALELLAGERPH